MRGEGLSRIEREGDMWIAHIQELRNLIPQMSEALFLLGSDGDKEAARQLVRRLYAETHDDGLAHSIREELGIELPDAAENQRHDIETARLNLARVRKAIQGMEEARDTLKYGSLRSAYNGAIDRFRVLESELIRLHGLKDTHEHN